MRARQRLLGAAALLIALQGACALNCPAGQVPNPSDGTKCTTEEEAWCDEHYWDMYSGASCDVCKLNVGCTQCSSGSYLVPPSTDNPIASCASCSDFGAACYDTCSPKAGCTTDCPTDSEYYSSTDAQGRKLCNSCSDFGTACTACSAKAGCTSKCSGEGVFKSTDSAGRPTCNPCNDFGWACSACKSTGCTQCAQGGYFTKDDAGNPVCEDCSNGFGFACAKCTKKGGCSKCSDGGYMTTGGNGLPECPWCGDDFGNGCFACDAKAGCTSAYDGAFINKTASGTGVAEYCSHRFGPCDACTAQAGCTTASKDAFLTTVQGVRIAKHCSDVHGKLCKACDANKCTSCRADGFDPSPNDGISRCDSCSDVFGWACTACNAAAGCTSCDKGYILEKGYCKRPGAISPACSAISLADSGGAGFKCSPNAKLGALSYFLHPGCSAGCTQSAGCRAPKNCAAGTKFVRPCGSAVGICLKCKEMGCPFAKCTNKGCPKCPKGKFKVHIGDPELGFDICVLASDHSLKCKGGAHKDIVGCTNCTRSKALYTGVRYITVNDGGSDQDTQSLELGATLTYCGNK